MKSTHVTCLVSMHGPLYSYLPIHGILVGLRPSNHNQPPAKRAKPNLLVTNTYLPPTIGLRTNNMSAAILEQPTSESLLLIVVSCRNSCAT